MTEIKTAILLTIHNTIFNSFFSTFKQTIVLCMCCNIFISTFLSPDIRHIDAGHFAGGVHDDVLRHVPAARPASRRKGPRPAQDQRRHL